MSNPVGGQSAAQPATTDQWLDFLEQQESDLAKLLQENGEALEASAEVLKGAQEACDAYIDGCNEFVGRVESLKERAAHNELAYKHLLKVIGSAATVFLELALKK